MKPATSPEGEMPTALATLAEEMRRRTDASQAGTQQVLTSFERLKSTLDRVTEKRESRELSDGDPALNRIDIVHITEVLSAGQFGALTAHEARFVVVHFLDREALLIGHVLEAHPRLWKVYLRRLLIEWYRSHDSPLSWSQFCELARRSPGELKVTGGPIPITALVRPDGADKAADATRASSLPGCYSTLTEEWGYGRSWDITAAATLAWIRKAGVHVDSAVRFLAAEGAGSALRAVLLPEINVAKGGMPGGINCSRGRDVARQHAVAELLRQRFAEKRMSEETFLLLEPFLLRGAFGDPRMISVAEGWRKVQMLEPQPYAAYLESLIREDLEFFFRQSMKEDDREQFWLAYVGTIRRTICVLGRDEYRRLSVALATATPEIKAALGRAARARYDVQDRANAFCLLFDSIAVVEFSVTGNAAYVYDRKEFDELILTQITSKQMNRVTDLKNKSMEFARFPHVSGWQEKLTAFLSAFGISRDLHRTRSPAR